MSAALSHQYKYIFVETLGQLGRRVNTADFGTAYKLKCYAERLDYPNNMSKRVGAALCREMVVTRSKAPDHDTYYALTGRPLEPVEAYEDYEEGGGGSERHHTNASDSEDEDEGREPINVDPEQLEEHKKLFLSCLKEMAKTSGHYTNAVLTKNFGPSFKLLLQSRGYMYPKFYAREIGKLLVLEGRITKLGEFHDCAYRLVTASTAASAVFGEGIPVPPAVQHPVTQEEGAGAATGAGGAAAATAGAAGAAAASASASAVQPHEDGDKGVDGQS